MPNQDYDRIERAITFIEDHAPQQPSLSQIAAVVGLSEYHFQRLFKRFAGVSPKRFMQFITAQEARRLLQESKPVLDAAFGVGLSSPGRLHDLTLNVYAMTPGEVARSGEGLSIRWGIHDSPFGRCLLGLTERGICWLSFPQTEELDQALGDAADFWPGAELKCDQAGTAPAAQQIFSPNPKHQGKPLHLLVRGTNFQIKVWEALLRIPPGAFIAYGDLAARLDKPRAARAVGAAVGANPISYLIPCHRVLRAGGAFGGYRWGLARKKALFVWETAGRRQLPVQE